MNMLHTKNMTRAIAIAAFLFIFTFTAHAQLSSSLFNVSISPATPMAHQEVKVSIESFTFDLRTAQVTWILNGRVSQRGEGIKVFTFKTGNLGTESSVQVIVVTSDGQELERSFEIRPAEVDLIWESIAYTPPFYKGKALAASKNKIKITAIPHFILASKRRIDPDNLTYTWQKDRRVLGSLSGTGKQSVTIDGPRLFENARITVLISSLSGTYNAQKEIIIRSVDPEIIFYEKHPTEGIKYEHALEQDFALTQEEIIVRAEPYFFSSEDLSSSRVRFTWTLNGNNVENISRVNEIVLRQEEGGGIAELSLAVENIAKILQEARKNIFIQFGEQTLFGR
ncbi:hypothetical protein CL630_01700 [bacterium]|nr:hypothetical protein [bacterium]|tara:strand:+ start:3866 stop:4882 length:1017 start_codon:yes stop_codon:yes gene_type:complete